MNSPVEARSNAGTGTHAWNRRARYFNSGNAFALMLSPVPSVTFIAERGALASQRRQKAHGMPHRSGRRPALPRAYHRLRLRGLNREYLRIH